jgi:hypothetical protein
MEQSPANRVTFHVRIINLLAILLLTDSLLANHAIQVTLTKGPNMMIMFGFEVSDLHVKCINQGSLYKYSILF